MKIDKFLITDSLRQNIVELRKRNGLSAYDLSEKSGHSKYWLPNIENGKTQKISKEDLLSIYSILLNKNEDSDIIPYIEQIIQQPLSSDTSWYKLHSVQESNILHNKYILTTHSPEQLKLVINSEFSNIKRQLFKIISDQPQENQIVALNALETFRRSVYFNSELSLALINIPLYGVNSENSNEYSTCINDLTALAAKYNDFANRKDIRQKLYIQENINKQLEEENYQIAQQVNTNYYNLLSLLKDQLINGQHNNLSNFLNMFYSSIVESLKRLVSDNLKNELPDINEIKSGDNFCDLIIYCSKLLILFQDDYNLSSPTRQQISTYMRVIHLLREVSTIQ